MMSGVLRARLPDVRWHRSECVSNDCSLGPGYKGSHSNGHAYILPVTYLLPTTLQGQILLLPLHSSGKRLKPGLLSPNPGLYTELL